LHDTTQNRLHSVLIIGATPAGVAAANKLGELGVPVTLVDQPPTWIANWPRNAFASLPACRSISPTGPA
jgi:2-polyprenyl-6-methoxyphenol hydroxylase-like FAD-dependent oxidoreductase